MIRILDDIIRGHVYLDFMVKVSKSFSLINLFRITQRHNTEILFVPL